MTTLILFPFAGATKYSFRPIVDALPDSVNVIVPELPGHGSRFGEAPLRTVDEMVQDIQDRIGVHGTHGVVAWGHSLGALLAYEYTRRYGGIGHLVVSGRAAPHLPRTAPAYSRLEGPAFVQALRTLGGTPEAVLADPDIMAVFEPVLRADFAAAESYTILPEDTVQAPLTILIGSNDVCTPESAMAWRERTSGSVRSAIVEGGHFFPLERPTETLAALIPTLFP